MSTLPVLALPFAGQPLGLSVAHALAARLARSEAITRPILNDDQVAPSELLSGEPLGDSPDPSPIPNKPMSPPAIWQPDLLLTG